ncbi:hypothetical protein UY286_08280 [Paenibacillus polymyxa]|uniref:hypothetical protein n=2 Tax=Paenibacillus TaxID=44249 RepID=UPI002AB337F8|nr:hypothetical protein [Paenibacillus polymyxa]MDY7990751.1 hypothetical protein [Paenibacillus polymyxa]MDY8117437.1 hypothetical protein [Paenibacillus polymyxa]
MAKDIFRMIQEANQAGEMEQLRREIPAASWPLTPAFEEALQAVRPIAFVNGGNEVILHETARWVIWRNYEPLRW